MYGFGLVDWRDGWFDGRVTAERTAEVFCELADAKERLQTPGRPPADVLRYIESPFVAGKDTLQRLVHAVNLL